MIIVSKIADCHRWSFYLSIINVVRVYDLNCFFIVPVDAIVLFCLVKSLALLDCQIQTGVLSQSKETIHFLTQLS